MFSLCHRRSAAELSQRRCSSGKPRTSTVYQLLLLTAVIQHLLLLTAAIHHLLLLTAAMPHLLLLVRGCGADLLRLCEHLLAGVWRFGGPGFDLYGRSQVSGVMYVTCPGLKLQLSEKNWLLSVVH